MDRFAALLYQGYRGIGLDTSLVRPGPRLGSMRRGGAGLGKWLGYVDKFVLFPPELRRAAAPGVVFHICDHSNSMYALKAGNRPTVVTVHDLLAVLGALGLQPDCPASFLGRRLQRWILRGLAAATMTPCVSTATRQDLLRLIPDRDPGLSPVVPDPLAPEYRDIGPEAARERLIRAGREGLAGGSPWLLHVGSNQPRKNKPALLRALALRVAAGWDGRLVLAGPRLDPAHDTLARELGVRDRLVVVEGPDNDTLAALYASCHAFCFPSRAEGFGWPLAEAQACGAAVVSTAIAPCREVAAGGALYHEPDEPAELAARLAELAAPERRAALIRAGLANARRFELGSVCAAYRDVCLRAAELHLRKRP